MNTKTNTFTNRNNITTKDMRVRIYNPEIQAKLLADQKKGESLADTLERILGRYYGS